MENNNYKSLKKYFDYDRLQGMTFQIIEFFLNLLAGGLVGAWIAEPAPSIWLKTTTCCTVGLLLVFTVFRLVKSAHFPNTVVDYLKVTDENKALKAAMDRKITIDRYVDKSIQALNLSTCSFSGQDAQAFCENPLDDGLKNVLDAVINCPHYILNCTKSKFTVALHLPWYPLKPNPSEPELAFLPHQRKTIVFRDDYNIKDWLTDNILEDRDAVDLQFDISEAGRRAFNHMQLVDVVITEGLKLVVAPVPAVCEGGRNGIIFIFCEEETCIPKDLENTLLIFGRITSNWISKYEDCVLSRHNKSKQISPQP